jgi:hypothetical protein
MNIFLDLSFLSTYLHLIHWSSVQKFLRSLVFALGIERESISLTCHWKNKWALFCVKKKKSELGINKHPSCSVHSIPWQLRSQRKEVLPLFLCRWVRPILHRGGGHNFKEKLPHPIDEFGFVFKETNLSIELSPR